jgi:hypothetical protein
VRDAANSFNTRQLVVNANRRVAVNVISVEDIDVWNNKTNWSDGALGTTTRPTLYIPAYSGTSKYIREDGRLPMEELRSSAAVTVMVWGGYRDRVEALIDYSQFGFDFQPIARSAARESWGAIGGDASWGFMDLAFSPPDQTVPGVAVMLIGAATYQQNPVLFGEHLRDPGFREWMAPVLLSVPNFNTLGANPAEAIAQRGDSVADIALLPESQWLLNLRGEITADRFMFAYPEYQVPLDFPIMIWSSTSVNPDERAAAEAFDNWLLDETRQRRAFDFGLRAVHFEVDDSARLFVTGESFGIQRRPDFGTTIVNPAKSDVQSMLTWYNQVQ